MLMAVEHSPKGRRGFYGSWPQVGVPVGLLLSTGVFGMISKLPEDILFSWGWRVAFLLSILIVGVGLYIRLVMTEPPVFAEVKQTAPNRRMPILDAVRQHPRNVILAMGARIAENGAFYLYTVFILTYATPTANRVLQAVNPLSPSRWPPPLKSSPSRPTAGCPTNWAAGRSIYSERSSPACSPSHSSGWSKHQMSSLMTLAIVARARGRTCGDVRATGELLLRTLRDASSLQRRFAWLPTRFGHRRRAFAPHRHQTCLSVQAPPGRSRCLSWGWRP